MELSAEDSLRLHVLLTNVYAVRIDPEAMEVQGLALDGDTVREARVALAPNCRRAQYLRNVREFLSGIVLGSPGGYPLHLARWTRMGQRRDEGLDKLLLLGEPEAVTAVAGAPGLTDELARRVWWIAPTPEHARRMLERELVCSGTMGPVLAMHLVEHLPFETDARVIMETVRLILQPGLITEGTRRRLWEMGAKQSAYCVGFLQAIPEDLPKLLPARGDLDDHERILAVLADAGNPVAAAVLRVLRAPGQTFIEAVRGVLRRPMDQDVIAVALDTIGSYFRCLGPQWAAGRDIQAIEREAVAACIEGSSVAGSQAARAVLRETPALSGEVSALLALGAITESVVTDILAHTTATGTLLQKKLAPVTEVILRQLSALAKIS
ncbi:MAG: sulfur reduction protein DsrS [Acidiferrobacteraceae bacterium]